MAIRMRWQCVMAERAGLSAVEASVEDPTRDELALHGQATVDQEQGPQYSAKQR